MNINEEVGANPVPQTTGASNSPTLLDYGQQTVPQRTAIPVPFTNVDTLFTALVFVCGYLFVWLVNPFSLGFGVTAFTLCFCCFIYKLRNIFGPKSGLYAHLSTIRRMESKNNKCDYERFNIHFNVHTWHV